MTTTQLLKNELHEAERERRRQRFEAGTSVAQRGTRIESKKAFRKGSRNAWKREI